ncbi:MAG TPA: helix-turn-helix domain-containing protein, partial [Burkholderiales bacterium]|nr:helix-turn-helix domain-containing protein [Burkholderiales bacterium]
PEEEEEQSEKETQAPKPERIEEPLPTYLDRLEREAILQALGKTGFNRTAAARLLGITFRQLRYRMQRLNIKDENR